MVSLLEVIATAAAQQPFEQCLIIDGTIVSNDEFSKLIEQRCHELDGAIEQAEVWAIAGATSVDSAATFC